MTESNKVKQTGNVILGDNAGRDIHKNTNIYNTDTSALRRRSDELVEKYVQDAEFKGFIEKLQKYLTPAEGQKKVRNLEEKLQAGNRGDLVEEALKLKEDFSKKIHKNQFSEQAQELFAHILAQINSYFNSKIRPLILKDTPSIEIDKLIYEELVMKIYDDVGTCKLDIDTQDIKGMLYYLTGNCHLEWDK
jgi:hypothetical protein